MNKTIFLVYIAVLFIAGFFAWRFINKSSTNIVPASINIAAASQPQNPTSGQTGAPVASASENSGVSVEVLKEGTGVGAKSGDMVTVDYIGTLKNGTKFDSSLDRHQPFSFTLGKGEVIKGWDRGLVGMKVGEKIKLTIPPDLAYGVNGVPKIIPPNSTLIFQVEMLKIGK